MVLLLHRIILSMFELIKIIKLLFCIYCIYFILPEKLKREKIVYQKQFTGRNCPIH